LKKGRLVRTAAMHYRSIWTAQTIFIGTTLAVAVSVLTVQILGQYLSSGHRTTLVVSSFIGHVAAFAFLALNGSIVAGAVAGAFRRKDRKALLITVITSYFSLMLVFASIYYEAAFFGDLQDAVFKYEHYRADALAHIEGPKYDDRRAFSGIARRSWSGVDWPVRVGTFFDGLPPSIYNVSPEQMRKIAGARPIEDVVQFIPEASLAIFADCLHLSVTSMTTLGYGDITPRSAAARFATDTEAVCNTLLLIFGLGMIFGNWRQVDEPTQPV